MRDAPQSGGLLVLDDTTLDKPYSQKIELVSRHWSGKHSRVVNGINLLSLVWTLGYSLEQYLLKSAVKSTSFDSIFDSISMPVVVPCDFRVYDVNADANGVHHTKNDHLKAMLNKAKERGFAPEYVAFDSWYSSQVVWLKGFGQIRLFQKQRDNGDVEHVGHQ